MYAAFVVFTIGLAAVRAQSSKFCASVDEWFPYNPAGGCTDQDPSSWCYAPKCPEEINLVYRAYSPSNPTNPVIFTRNQVPSGFVGTRRTYFIVHGWQTRFTNDGWLVEMKNELLAQGSYNVIIVDWSAAGTNLNYPQPASETRTVGADVAYIARNFAGSTAAVASNMHCIGHSLGAHVCGHAATRVPNFGRATGMDPAGPAFTAKPVTEGIHPNAANFVDIIHSDSVFYGSKRAIGNADFYPADGNTQPGCSDLLLKDWEDMTEEDWELYGDFLGCSHGRAVDYMRISIRNNCFLSRHSCSNANNIPGSCSSCNGVCARMGFHASTSQRGLFRLDINPTNPFCAN